MTAICKFILNFRSLPPSPGAALIQLKKALFVAGKIWSRANEPVLNYEDMDGWGWQRDGDKFVQIWTAMPCPSESVFEDCFRKCSKNCKCTTCNCRIKFKYACLPECGCAGKCVAQENVCE